LPRGALHIVRCKCDNLFHFDCVEEPLDGCGMCATPWPASSKDRTGSADLDHETDDLDEAL
jgi:hypothetical protein